MKAKGSKQNKSVKISTAIDKIGNIWEHKQSPQDKYHQC